MAKMEGFVSPEWVFSNSEVFVLIYFKTNRILIVWWKIRPFPTRFILAKSVPY